jgi:hypothetical protein
MPYFNVEELSNLSFSGKSAYVLPESVKTMLIELESCLEITDAATDAPEKKEYKSYDSRRGTASNVDSSATVKYRNRYDFDTPISRGGERDNRDKKKRDFRQKDGGAPSSSSHNNSHHNSNTSKDEPEVDKEWEMMRAFKATKIESKTGIEKTINDLRIALNKISAANYEKQRDVILTLVNGYFDAKDDQTDANTRRISKAIFDIASTNKFYSEMYAKLYKELVGTQAVFLDLLVEMIEGFMAMDSIPMYVDPDSDYDGFCVYSKACDIRKSTSTFIVNCLKFELLLSDRVAEVLSKFVEYVENKRTEPGFSKCVEEIVENIYIITTLCAPELSKTAKWNEYILPRIRQFVSEKGNGLPSMSNRAMFKCMDLLEKI